MPGSVYIYGTQPGVWGPDTLQIPAVRKGAIRVASEAQYRAASQRGVQVIILRSGDFLAPQSSGSFWNSVTLKGLARGKITTMAKPDVTRAYAYLPDMGRIAVALSEKRAALAAFTDMPFAGYTLSTADLKAHLERLMGRSLQVTGFAWWFMTLASPVWELARELRDMRYLYDHSHSLDPAPLVQVLPDFRATPLDVVLREHIEQLVPSQGSASLIQTGR